MEILFFVLLSIFLWPIRWLLQLCSPKKLSTKPSKDSAVEICQNSLAVNLRTPLLWASSQDYTDMWTRDTWIASWGMDSRSVRPLLECMARYQREDGLIPLFIGRGDACCKLFCKRRPYGPAKPVYADAKTGNCPTDSCFQFIMMAHKLYPRECKRAWDFMQTKVKDGLIYENGLGTWQDTIKHRGHVAFTNILYHRACSLLYPERADAILKQLIRKLWTKNRYFKASTTNNSFGHVDNALALMYNIAPETKFLRKQLSKFGWTSPPNTMLGSSEAPFKWYEVYLPCYPIGNSDYHTRWAWSWVFLLVKKALNDTDLWDVNQQIKKYGSLYETYDENGEPVCRLLYKSQPNFSEACGLYLDLAGASFDDNARSLRF